MGLLQDAFLWSAGLPGIANGVRFVILLRSPYPGLLPGHILIIGAKPYVGAVTLGNFERLVLSDRDRGGASETGASSMAVRIVSLARGHCTDPNLFAQVGDIPSCNETTMRLEAK